jgi:hypothetical protein
MLVDFKEMPKTSRVWIYQSDKYFSDEEVQKIASKIEVFIENWNNHGEGLKASYQIKYNHFIVLTVDENFKSASGCSIDSSVQLIKQIENEFQTDLFNKLNISFKNGEHINIVTMTDFQKYAKENKINADTIVFNNMVNSIKDFETNWEVEARDSWHARFVN